MLLWQTGGAGVFWLGRSIDQITKDEAIYMEHEQRSEGLLLWCPFNSLLNSSTRTELAAVIVAIIPPVPVHIGIDNVAVVGKGSQIIKYYDEREKMKKKGGRKRKEARRDKLETEAKYALLKAMDADEGWRYMGNVRKGNRSKRSGMHQDLKNEGTCNPRDG